MMTMMTMTTKGRAPARAVRRMMTSTINEDAAATRCRAVYLTLACVEWYLASIPEPLVVGYEREDGEDSPAWAAETAQHRAYCDGMLEMVGEQAAQVAALELLREDEATRRQAWHAVQRLHPTHGPVSVHVFGPGWREHGAVTVG